MLFPEDEDVEVCGFFENNNSNEASPPPAALQPFRMDTIKQLAELSMCDDRGVAGVSAAAMNKGAKPRKPDLADNVKEPGTGTPEQADAPASQRRRHDWTPVGKDLQPPSEAQFYLLDNSLLRSQSTGVRMRTGATVLENSTSTPMLKWGVIVRGVEYEAQGAPAEEVEAAELSLRDIYGRKFQIKEEPGLWLRVTQVRGARGRLLPATRPWYLPFDITGVPILVHQPGMESDAEDVDEDDGKMLEMCVPDPTDELCLQPGSGMLYEVMAPTVVLRSSPSVHARMRGGARKGCEVELFGWDESLKWRQALDSRGQSGWMLLDHPDHGPLLRPKGAPFQVTPLQPMCAAVMEPDLQWLAHFISQEMDVNVRDAGGRTPMMVAAEHGCRDAFIMLAAANADAMLHDDLHKTVVEWANSLEMKALAQALTRQTFSVELCQSAIDGIKRAELQELAQELLDLSLRKMRALQAAGLQHAAAPKPGQKQDQAAEETDTRSKAAAVKALALRGKCALCEERFRQAAVLDCCAALICDQCIVHCIYAKDKCCPGCGTVVEMESYTLLNPTEARQRAKSASMPQTARASEDTAKAARA